MAKRTFTMPKTMFAVVNKPFALRPSDIHDVPDGHQALSLPEKQALLKIQGNQYAETQTALQELVDKHKTLAEDLGKKAPDPELVKALLDRMMVVQEVNRKVQLLASYLDHEESLINHDVVTILNSTVSAIDFFAQENPQIAERYPQSRDVIAQRRQAISDGIARAKAAKTGAAPTPASDNTPKNG